VLPALFNIWGINAQIPVILFGLGVLQVLTLAPAGIAHQFPPHGEARQAAVGLVRRLA